MEVERSLRVLDGAVVVFDGVSGWNRSRKRFGGRRTNTKCREFALSIKWTEPAPATKSSFQTILGNAYPNVVRIQLPIGLEEEFRGIVDLLEKKGYKLRARKGKLWWKWKFRLK